MRYLPFLTLLLAIGLFRLNPLKAQGDYINVLAYSKNSDRIALGYSDGRLEVFQVNGPIIGERIFADQALSRIDSLEWSPFSNDSLLITTGQNEVYELNFGLSEPTYGGGTYFAAMHSAVWSADGTQILVNNAPDRIFYQTDILDYPSFETNSISYDGEINALGFNPERTRQVISTIGNFKDTYIRNVSDQNVTHTFSFPESSTGNVNYIDWNNGVIALSDGYYFAIYDENSYALLWEDDSDQLDLKDIAIRPNTTQIAFVDNKIIRLFDWASQQYVVLQSLPNGEGISQIAWTTDGNYLATSNGSQLYIQAIPFVESGTPIPTPSYKCDVTPANSEGLLQAVKNFRSYIDHSVAHTKHNLYARFKVRSVLY